MHAWLQRIWYGGVPAPGWLRALARLHAWQQRGVAGVAPGRTPDHLAPVIVVGNLTVGGTGKTPLVIWLCGQLQALGLRPAVVSRGYGGSQVRNAGVLRVEPGHTADLCGDEPLLVRRRAGVPVYVARERALAAAQARAEGAQVLVADDGLQHRALARDCELVVIDGQRGFGNGLLLPAGPLREPLARLASVGAVIVNSAGDTPPPGLAGTGLPPPPVLGMELVGDTLQGLGEPDRTMPLAALAGRRVHAVAALGNPGRFFATLRAAGLELLTHPLRDHQPIPPALLRPADRLPVLVSEKDAVKCAPQAHAGCWYLPVAARFSAADAHALLRRVIMDARLLDILACPLCKGPLRHVREGDAEELVCRADRLAFPVREGIPVMLEEEARVLVQGDALLER